MAPRFGSSYGPICRHGRPRLRIVPAPFLGQQILHPQGQYSHEAQRQKILVDNHHNAASNRLRGSIILVWRTHLFHVRCFPRVDNPCRQYSDPPRNVGHRLLIHHLLLCIRSSKDPSLHVQNNCPSTHQLSLANTQRLSVAGGTRSCDHTRFSPGPIDLLTPFSMTLFHPYLRTIHLLLHSGITTTPYKIMPNYQK